MIIGYDRPAMTFSATSGSFVTDSGRLANGRPQSRARIQIQPDSSGTFVLTVNFGGSSVPAGISGLVGTDLPVGASVTADLIRTGDASYGYLSATTAVVERRDGVRACWFAYPEGSDACYAMQLTIDVSGVETDSSGIGYIEIGEIWYSAALRHCAMTDYKVSDDSNSSYESSVSGQPFAVRRRQGHEHSFSLAPAYYDAMYADPTDDPAKVQQSITRHAPAVIVPYTAIPFTGGSDSQAVVNHHAAFGFFGATGTMEYKDAPAITLAGLKFVEVAS